MNIPDLIPDVVGVIYELMDGETRYRMSMITRGWNHACRGRVVQVYTVRDLAAIAARGDALELIASYDNFHRITFMKYLGKSGLSFTKAYMIRTGLVHAATVGVCSAGHTALMRSILSMCNKFDLEIGLQYACRYEQFDMIKLLLPHCSDRWYGFIGAIESGNLSLVKRMQNPALQDRYLYGYKFIHANRTAMYKEVIEFLNVPGANDMHSLPAACYSGDKDLIQYVISRGCNNWNRGLKYAVIGNKLYSARIMLAMGAFNIMKAIGIACERGYKDIFNELWTLDRLDNNSLNALFCTAMFGPDLTIADIVLEKIGSLQAKYVNVAALSAAMSGNPDAVRYMLKYGARNYDSMIFHCISHGYSKNVGIIIDAFKNRSHDIIRHEYDIYTDDIDIDYQKILERFHSSSLFTVLGVKTLICYGAVPTSIHVDRAVAQGNNEIIEYLVGLLEIDPMEQLRLAIHYNRCELTSKLLKRGIVPTPAMLKDAARSFDRGMYKMVLRAYKKSI